MSELSEITFENVQLIELSKLAEELLYPNILSATYNGDDMLDNLSTNLIQKHILNMKDGDSIFLNMSKIDTTVLEIPSCTAQIMGYDGKFDLNLIFDVESLVKLSDVSLPYILRDFAQDIAQRYAIDSFCGGLEPASDKETQYFSGSNLGPLAVS